MHKRGEGEQRAFGVASVEKEGVELAVFREGEVCRAVVRFLEKERTLVTFLELAEVMPHFLGEKGAFLAAVLLCSMLCSAERKEGWLLRVALLPTEGSGEV